MVDDRRQGQGRGGRWSSAIRTAARSTSRTSTLTEHPSFGLLAARSPTSSRSPRDRRSSLDSQRSISGDLELSEPDGGPVIGALSIVKGKVNKTFTKLSLKGTIEGVDGPVVVKLKGVRPPNSFPVLTGRTNEGNSQGQGREEQGDRPVGASKTPCSACRPTCSRARGRSRSTRTRSRTRRSPAASFSCRSSRRSGSSRLERLRRRAGEGEAQRQGSERPRAEAGPQPRSRAQAEAEGTADRGGRADPVGRADELRLPPDASRRDLRVHVQRHERRDRLLSGTASSSAARARTSRSRTPTAMDRSSPATRPTRSRSRSSRGRGRKTATLRFSVEAGAGANVVPITGAAGVSEITVDPDPIAFGNVAISHPRSSP